MNQPRLVSLIEACVNTAIGFVINMAGQYVIFPVLGIAVTHAEHLWIAAFFTVISIARGYGIRRWFNMPAVTAAILNFVDDVSEVLHRRRF